MQTGGFKQLMEQVVRQNLCTACGACVGICPYLKIHRGQLVGVFDCDLEQGRCFRHCPKTGVDRDELSNLMSRQSAADDVLGDYRRIAASRTKSAASATRFQNGGTVSTLIVFALENGWIDGAILTGSEGMAPVPKIVTEREAVLACSTTKYSASPTMSCLNQAAQEGRRNLGLVGTACQLTGAAKMRTNPLAIESFVDPVSLTIGLFCTWSLNHRLFLAYIKDRLDGATIVRMDVPPPPAEKLIVETDKGTLEYPLAEIRPLASTGCQACFDMTAEWADISVGACEGKPGWNTLIVRSEKGEQLVDAAVKMEILEIDALPPENLDQLRSGAENKQKRAMTARVAK